MTKFLIIRHGQSEANLLDVFAGNFDAPLTERGLCQAQRTAEYIKENYKVDKVVASDLKRAFVTGKTLSDMLGLEITSTSELREISAGDWEGVPFTTIKKEYPEIYDKWFRDMSNCRTPNGESVRELGDRIFGCFKRLAEENPDSTVAVATHATPIRVLQAIITYGDVSGTQHVNWVTNASVSTVIYDNGKWAFTEVSYDKHLDGILTTLPKYI